MNTFPATKRLLRLISARNDMSVALDAFGHFMTFAGSPPAEHFFFAMVIAYGRPFTENCGIGPIRCEYPTYPDFADEELNLRHRRMIDIRNKFLAHSSAEGTRVMVVPPSVVNPITEEKATRFNHNVGKRTFLDPRYAEWLITVAYAFKGRLVEDVRKQLQTEFASPVPPEVFELQTGWDKFSWTKPDENCANQQPPLQTPASGTPAAGPPVAAPPGAPGQ
jgi:hypothetical protein